jgi:hypothetical protein
MSHLKSSLYEAIILSFMLLSGCANNPTNQSGKEIIIYEGTVNGKIVDNFGVPVSGQTISYISSDTQYVTSASDGSFTLYHVKTPYQLVLIRSYNNFLVYQGLNSFSPIICNGFGGNYSNQTNILVTIPDSTNISRRAVVFFTDLEGNFTSYNQQYTSTQFILNVQFYLYNQNIINGKVIVLEYTVDNHLIPQSYDKYGEKLITVQSGSNYTMSFTEGDLTTNPGQQTMTCDISLPAGANGLTSSLHVSRGTAYNPYVCGARLYENYFSPQHLSLLVPGSVTNFRFYLYCYTNSPFGLSEKVIEVHPGNNLMTLDNYPVVLNPQNYATNIDYNTEFSFNTSNGPGVYSTGVTSITGPYQSVDIISTSETIKIPDLRYLDFDLYGKQFSLRIGKYVNFNSMDEFMSAALFVNPLWKSHSEFWGLRFSFSPPQK